MTFQPITAGQDTGERGDIHDGEFVEPMVIVYNPEGSILLFDCEGWETILGWWRDDVALLQVFLEVLIKGFLFFWG